MAPRRRRSTTAALVTLVPLAFLATACGGIGHGWAGDVKTASDSPVGNSGAPNTGITARALAERAAEADREARGVRSEFSGTVYGEAMSGDSLVTKAGDSEAHLRVGGRGIHKLTVGGHTYTLVDPGAYEALFGMLAKAPNYDADSDGPPESMGEFYELMEGKYLVSDKDDEENGLLVFNGFLDEVPFEDSGSDFGDDADSDDYDSDSDDDEDEEYYDSGDIDLSLGETTRINGIEVIPLIATSHDDGTTSIATMYLPAHGTPLPVRTTSDEDNDGRIDATLDYRYFGLDGGKTVTAPKDKDSVDLEEAFAWMFRDDEPWDGSDSPYAPDGGGVTV